MKLLNVSFLLQVDNRECNMHNQELSMQEESQGFTFDSQVFVKGEHRLVRSSYVNAVSKDEFFADEFITHTTEPQKIELENESKCELPNVCTIPNSLNFALSNMSVVIKEELILEDADQEHLTDKVL